MSSSLLLCEALGFSPQLLLDDIINIANNAVQDGVNGMEEFFQKWAAERGPRGEPSQLSADTTTHEVEQGLVAFQTLLEYHTDIAFDFFEAWCLRNVFMVPRDLPIVLPHQATLDLSVSPDQEEDLIREVNALRKRLDNVYSPLILPASTALTTCVISDTQTQQTAPSRYQNLFRTAFSSQNTLDAFGISERDNRRAGETSAQVCRNVSNSVIAAPSKRPATS